MLSSSICSFIQSFSPLYNPDSIHPCIYPSVRYMSSLRSCTCSHLPPISMLYMCCFLVTVATLCMLCFVDRQTDRHALVILISMLHLKLHVRFLICAAAQTCDPHMKPQFTSPPPGLLCPSNAERHNLSFLFCSGQGSTRPQAICFGHSSTARPRHGVPCGGNLTSRSLFKPQAAVLP